MMRASAGFATPLIDINAEVGARVPANRTTGVSDVLAIHDRFGISLSLVRHTKSVQVDRAQGNAELIDEVRGAGATDRIAPVAVASTLNLDSLRDDLAAAERGGARAVWLEGVALPPTFTSGSWTTRSSATERMLDIALSVDLPLLVPCHEWGDASAIGELTRGADVPIILVEARYPNFADVFAALARYPHLHIESSSLGSFDAIETMIGVSGAERILFGSGHPVRTPRSPLNALLMAQISDNDREGIAGGNAMRIFGFDVEPTMLEPPTLPERAFDVHGHLFPAPWEVPRRAPGSPIGLLRRFGIEHHVASSIPAFRGYLEEGNADTVAACSDEPDQLGYLVASPWDVSTSREHLQRWRNAPGIVGVKVHGESSRVPTTSARMRELFSMLAEFTLPVKIHNYGEGWEQALLDIAREHPDLPIVVAHAGYHRPQPSVAAIINGSDNVHIELASSKADLEDARELVALVDTERVLFGTDAPLLNPSFVLGLYQELGLSDEVLARVYWDNGVRLYGAGSAGGAAGGNRR